MKESVGRFELQKFASRKSAYHDGMKEMLAMGYDASEFIQEFPAFTGHMTIARYVSLYEAYKMTLGVAGHIAEIGVFRGAGSLFFAKLTRLFEPESLTLVHGFDWFQGAKTSPEEKYVEQGECREDQERLLKLIRVQGLESVVHIHNLDLTKDLGKFFDENSHMQFKLVFLDCGTYDVVSSSLKHFWPRLTSGGVLLFDHFNHEVAPGETRAIKEFMPDAKIKTFPFGWMPTAYVVKP